MRARPAESVAGATAFAAGGARLFQMLKASEYMTQIHAFFTQSKALVVDGYAAAKDTFQEVGWEGVLAIVSILFLVFRILFAQPRVQVVNVNQGSHSAGYGGGGGG